MFTRLFKHQNIFLFEEQFFFYEFSHNRLTATCETIIEYNDKQALKCSIAILFLIHNLSAYYKWSRHSYSFKFKKNKKAKLKLKFNLNSLLLNISRLSPVSYSLYGENRLVFSKLFRWSEPLVVPINSLADNSSWIVNSRSLLSSLKLTNYQSIFRFGLDFINYNHVLKVLLSYRGLSIY